MTKSPSQQRHGLRMLVIAIACGGLLCCVTNLDATETVKPPVPPPATPPLDTKAATVVCVNCDQKFEFPGHEEVNASLVGNKYVRELRQAMYLQDTYHQFESRAHFDNCAFGEATQYIDELLTEAGAYVANAEKAKAAARQSDAETYTQKAFFAIGQALHAVQDFFAHSNYVELMNGKFTKASEIPVLHPWLPRDIKRIAELRKQGLISGYVFWGFPQTCPKAVPTHANLAKDSETTKSGKVKLPHLENLTQYKVALFLAKEASKDLVVYAFERWPLLAHMNGQYVAFEIFQERRGL